MVFGLRSHGTIVMYNTMVNKQHLSSVSQFVPYLIYVHLLSKHISLSLLVINYIIINIRVINYYIINIRIINNY